MDGEFYTDFKSSNRIAISSLVQVLLNFDQFWGSPWGCGRWVDGSRGGYGCVGGHPMPTCMHVHVCTHMHVKHDKHGCLHVGGHLQFLYMHLHVCACVCMFVVIPPMPPDTPHPSTPPQSCRKPKTPKFNKSWTNQDISILFENSLPLNTPELTWTIVDHPRHPTPACPIPQSRGNPN